ncbi:MAG: hypothetical protein ACPGJJ_03395, partial [Parvibaculales bacterium]
MLKITVFAGFLGVSLISSGFAANQPFAEYGDWRMFVSGAGQSKNCYIAGEPKRSTPKNARRGDVFLIIAHRPGQGVRNEISVRIGYPFSATSEPF